MCLLRFLVLVFLCIFVQFSIHAGEDTIPEDGNWVGKSLAEKEKAEKMRVQQFCWSYIKGLRTLYIDIDRDGLEKTLALHPPQDEGASMEMALKIGAEIEGLVASGESPSPWLDGKWNACLKDPYTVGK